MTQISFESLGGVGDGNLITGEGTDNAEAFARATKAGEEGHSVLFARGKIYKTTRQIMIHNMSWVGDLSQPPIIFGWFSTGGKRIIGRNPASDRKAASLVGLRLHRCGPHPEHGILIDNMRSFNFDGWVTAIAAGDTVVSGGAIGVSSFQPEHRPSSNVTVKARLTNSANFGVQYGNVNGGTLQVMAENCMREVIGIEPYCVGTFDFTQDDVKDDVITLPRHGMQTGWPMIYGLMDAKAAVEGLPRANYWFVIAMDQDRVRLATSESDAAAGKGVTLGRIPSGKHRLFKCGITENIRVLPSVVNNLNPPIERFINDADGVLVFTATSGGYARNIDTGSIRINDFNNRAPGYCVSWLGLWDFTLSGLDIRGGRLGGIRVGRGMLNGIRDAKGASLDPTVPALLIPKGRVERNVIRDFPRRGISLVEGDVVITSNRVLSASVDAVGISTLRDGARVEDNQVSVQRGVDIHSAKSGQ